MLRSTKFFSIWLGLCLTATPLAAQPTYQEDMSRQRAQEQQIMQQNYDEAEYAAANQGDDDDYEYDRGSRFASAPPEPWRNYIAESMELQQKHHEHRMANDPVYRKLNAGVWTFLQSDPGDPQPMCAATFWAINGGVTMIHWGGKLDITMLGFFGAMIPARKDPGIFMLDLTQSGEKQTVRGINMTFTPAPKLGLVLFAVPSAGALLNSIEDRQDFQIDYQGSTLMHGEWHSGLTARDALTKCLAAQAATPPKK